MHHGNPQAIKPIAEGCEAEIVTTGSITLGQIAERLRMIEVRCGRCPRAGRLSLARLIAVHGPDAAIGIMIADLVADCPNREAPVYQRCDPHWPELPAWFIPAGGAPTPRSK